MKDGDPGRRFELATWALMLTPMLLLFGFLTLAVHVWIGLGHSPQPMVEEYHSAAYNLHGWAFMVVACFTVWGAIPCWLVLVVIQRFRRCCSYRLHIVQTVVYAAGWGIIAGYCTWDPGSFVAWFLD